jgi:DNA-binding IclR family transcriptional regulator
MTATVPEVAEIYTDEWARPGLPVPSQRGMDSSAGKSLALLDAFCGQQTILGVTALAAKADIAKSTAHRLLTVLVSHGYVRRVGDRYCLTEHAFEVGNRVPACRPSGIRELAMPYLGDLYAQTRQTIHLAVLTGTDVLYLDKVFGHDSPRCPTSVGSRRPAYTTALGKAMLAFGDSETVEANLRVRFRRLTPSTMVSAAQMQRCLERVSHEGTATDHEESLTGVNCIAAPILDRSTGTAIAAISICSTTPWVEQRYGRFLIRALDELSRNRAPESRTAS